MFGKHPCNELIFQVKPSLAAKSFRPVIWNEYGLALPLPCHDADVDIARCHTYLQEGVDPVAAVQTFHNQHSFFCEVSGDASEHC